MNEFGRNFRLKINRALNDADKKVFGCMQMERLVIPLNVFGIPVRHSS
jgi:hypothetical protein